MPTTIELLASALARAICDQRTHDVEACNTAANAEHREAASNREERAAARALAIEKAIVTADAESEIDALVQMTILVDRLEAMHGHLQDEHAAETNRLLYSVLDWLVRKSGKSPADLGLDWYYQMRPLVAGATATELRAPH